MRAARIFGRHPGTWLPPLLIVLALAAALPAVYLGGTVDPGGHLRDLPVALVVEPQTSTANNAADQIAAAIRGAVNHDAVDLIPMSPAEEQRQLGGGK
ncbi:hypothetical protein ACW9HQ_49245, partial [Nocardia gipuzkoensis]